MVPTFPRLLAGVDTDIPTALEGYLITSTATCYLDHTLRKAVFMACQIFAYAFRPMLVKPSLVPRDGWIALNWLVQARAPESRVTAVTVGHGSVTAFHGRVTAGHGRSRRVMAGSLSAGMHELSAPLRTRDAHNQL